MNKNGKSTVMPESIERALIQRKRDEIQKELDAFTVDATRQIAAFRGALQAYDMLLDPPVEAITEAEAKTEPIAEAESAAKGETK